MTTIFSAADAHLAADIQVANANAALSAAAAVRHLSNLILSVAIETDTSAEPGDRNDLAFCGLTDIGYAAHELAAQLQRKGENYRKGLI